MIFAQELMGKQLSSSNSPFLFRARYAGSANLNMMSASEVYVASKFENIYVNYKLWEAAVGEELECPCECRNIGRNSDIGRNRSSSTLLDNLLCL